MGTTLEANSIMFNTSKSILRHEAGVSQRESSETSATPLARIIQTKDLDGVDARHSTKQLRSNADLLRAIAPNLKFGTEVEHQKLEFAQVANIVHSCVGGTIREKGGWAVHAEDGRVWRLVCDAGGVELITPIMEGPNDLQIIQSIVGSLRTEGGAANKGAGLHVHLDGARFSPSQIQALIDLLARNESWLYPVLGVHANRRESFCTPISRTVALGCAAASIIQRSDLACLWGANRFRGLNLQNYFDPRSGGKDTIEFRYFNGTVDPSALGCAVGFCMGIARHILAQPADQRAPQGTSDSLPQFLEEVGITHDEEIAAHLHGLLRQRIEEGLGQLGSSRQAEILGALPDAPYVRDLCRLLKPGSSPADIATLALCLYDMSPERRTSFVTLAQPLTKEDTSDSERSKTIANAEALPASERAMFFNLLAQGLLLQDVSGDARLNAAVAALPAHVRTQLVNLLQT